MARWDACHSTAVQKDGDTSSKDHVDRDNDEDGESDEMKSNARKADKSWSRFGVQSECHSELDGMHFQKYSHSA